MKGANIQVKGKNLLNTMKIMISVASIIVLSTSIMINPVDAQANEQILQDTILNQNYYRFCDMKTGEILEKYDTAMNGINDIEYLNLATSMSEEKTDRITAMNFITVIYDFVTNEEKIFLKSYIKNYAPYTNEENLQNFCQHLSSITARSTSEYFAADAIEYAHQYWQNYNDSYPDLNNLGGDCANFVSQCLHAGGKQMNGDWYIYQKNSTYMSPTNITQLNYSWDLANPSPWISAEEFNNYWSDFCNTYEYTLSNYQSSHNFIYNSEQIKIGDPFLLLKKVLWWYEGDHVMIIVGLDQKNNDFIYAGHSNNRIDGKILENICESYSGNYKIKFFSM